MKWISVDERLPPPDEPYTNYLVWVAYGEGAYSEIATYWPEAKDHNYGFLARSAHWEIEDWNVSEEIYQHVITHWMPLPDPPEATP